MTSTEILKARVSPEIRAQAKAFAEREMLTEAAWLKRLVLRELRMAPSPALSLRDSCSKDGSRQAQSSARASNTSSRPVYVRLRHEDRLLLHARAEARGLRTATYLSVLTRAHLRALTPLPKDELLALKLCIGELASIGRNINQIAKAANEGSRVPNSVREEFRAMLKICEALRNNTKALLKANELSWSTGSAETNL